MGIKPGLLEGMEFHQEVGEGDFWKVELWVGCFDSRHHPPAENLENGCWTGSLNTKPSNLNSL